MADCMNKELFLDILTKDEREALLTKKMEEIRKKNEALRKRHEEIEADKRVAAKDNPNKDVNSYSREAIHSGSSSPRKESKPLPGEEKRGPRPNKPGGGRGRAQGGGKSKEKRPQPHTGEIDVTDGDANDGGDEQSERRNARPCSNHEIAEREQVADAEDGEVEVKRFRPKRNRRVLSATSENSDEETPRKGHFTPNNRPPRRSGMLGPEDGPPPDPSYNFLADRRREGTSKEAPSNMEYHGDKSPRKGDTRRHPKNYGGQDFNNVKAQIRSSKERQERPKSGPPRTKMELAMSMTGKERKQYMEWKAERERVDLERLERQKSNTGEWRRAWDADKNQQDFEQPSSPQRSEPAKRPAGRIGSGRFDRGEREERHRGDAPRQKGVKTENEAQTKPIGRGRARGRGRGRGRGDRSPRQRTFSSGDESRKVERQKDLLVVKIDNSGKDTNQSVEVEYWDDDLVDAKSNSAASVKSAASSRDGHSNHARNRRQDDHQFDDPDDGQDGDNGYVSSHHRRHTQSHSLGDENEHDESWEDCPEDAEFYAEEEYADGDERYKEPLKLECKLNPDAPEFTPTSPDFMKTPPGHVKVMDWVTEVNSNLSPTSPPPTMDGVNNEECKKALFKDNKSDSAEKKQSSSNGGVTQSDTKTSEEELSASYTEDNEPSNTAAPEASEEFLDASGDLGEYDESQEVDQEDKQEAESLNVNVSGKSEEKEEVEPSPQQAEKTDKEKEEVEKTGKEEVEVKTPSPQQAEKTAEEEEDVALPSPQQCDAELSPQTGGDVKSAVEVEDTEIQSESSAKSEDSALDSDPSINIDVDVNVKASEKTDDLPKRADSDTKSSSADASEEATDMTGEQMATSDLTSESSVSDHTVQSQQLVHETEPTEDNQKSSVPETVVETTSPPPTTTTTAVEDSHVE